MIRRQFFKTFGLVATVPFVKRFGYRNFRDHPSMWVTVIDESGKIGPRGNTYHVERNNGCVLTHRLIGVQHIWSKDGYESEMWLGKEPPILAKSWGVPKVYKYIDASAKIIKGNEWMFIRNVSVSEGQWAASGDETLRAQRAFSLYKMKYGIHAETQT